MATNNTRFMLTIPEEIAKRAEVLKKNIFYDRPYAEMYRQLIQLGMNVLEENQKNDNSFSDED